MEGEIALEELPLNSTTATGTPSCVPPGLKSLVALQFSSNYDSEESNATGAERRASEECQLFCSASQAGRRRPVFQRVTPTPG